MTPEQIQLIVEESERLWRSRTPAANIQDVNASSRVTMSELIRWGNINGISIERMDEDLQEAWTRLFFRLRKEFPNDNWDYLNSATREFCKLRKIPIPKGTR